jgi:hypothetical protein
VVLSSCVWCFLAELSCPIPSSADPSFPTFDFPQSARHGCKSLPHSGVLHSIWKSTRYRILSLKHFAAFTVCTRANWRRKNGRDWRNTAYTNFKTGLFCSNGSSVCVCLSASRRGPAQSCSQKYLNGGSQTGTLFLELDHSDLFETYIKKTNPEASTSWQFGCWETADLYDWLCHC